MSLFEIKRSQALKNLFITILFYFSKFKIEKTMERNSKKIKNTIKSIYGNCYSFNTGLNSSGHSVDIQTISKPGNINGLKLELFMC